MYRSAVRSTPRALSAARQSAIRAAPRRFASTTPADKLRSWKGSALRWGLAVGAVYWYNTSPVFAEEPLPRTIPAPSQFSDSDLTTVDAIVEEKRKRAIVKAEEAKPTPAAAPAPTESSEKTQEALEGGEGAPALEAEAGQQGAFNPETGEINWDCPCLGGMADGPCGEEFKAAFSCFVYSTEEPKGIDCIEKFQYLALDANTDATIAPPAPSVDEKKETKADSPDQAPRAEIKGESEEKKPAAKSDADKQEKEAKKVPEPEPVDLTQPNTRATDATAANNN
ncbi:mitochondrial intermembrane space import and assembly protein 40 [Colletotrichum tofieldiae]|nr:mitochondrial intermembrane space import and assembly protein 40 [Colletotrichum tofieldiae]